MSIKVMEMIWERAPYVEPTILLTLLCLANWANDDGICWPSVPSLARKTRQSERNARYILKRLESDGILGIQEQRGRNHTNHYMIDVEKLATYHTWEPEQKPAKPEKPAKPAKIVAGFNDDENLQNLQPSVGKPAIAIAPEPSVEPSVKDPTPTPPIVPPITPVKPQRKSSKTPRPIPTWSDDLPWPDPYSLVALYHVRKPAHWSVVTVMSESRLQKLTAYLGQFQEIDFWERVFAELHVPWSFELRENNCCLDWLLQKGKNDQVENCLKVSEQKYRKPCQTPKRLELKL
jgi:Helix-turn-helix domain